MRYISGVAKELGAYIQYELCVLVCRLLHGLGTEYLSSDFTLVADVLSRQRLRAAAGACVVVPVRLGDAHSATAPSRSLLHGLGMHCHRRSHLHRIFPPSGVC